MHVITRFDGGGSAKNTYLSLLGLKKKGYDLSLVSGASLESEMKHEEYEATEIDIQKLKSEGIDFIRCSSLVRRIHFANDFKAFLSLWKIFKKNKPQIIHTHSSKAGLLGRIAAKLAGVPARVHTPHGHVFQGYFGPVKTRFFIFLERRATRLTDRIIALTQREKEDYVKFKIAKQNKLAVIHSGIELDKYRGLPEEEKKVMKKSLGIPDNAFVAGTAGRLVSVKGPEYLLKAAQRVISKYQDTYFLIAGDGSLKESMENLAYDLGIKKNAVFLGWRNDLIQIISIFDVFVLSSLNEGMGRVLAEAMALGKPIVASNTGGIPDIVEHGKNGFLVPPKDYEQIAECIQSLIDNPGERERMGELGKKRALDFSYEIMVEKISNLYEGLMLKKNIPFS